MLWTQTEDNVSKPKSQETCIKEIYGEKGLRLV